MKLMPLHPALAFALSSLWVAAGLGPGSSRDSMDPIDELAARGEPASRVHSAFAAFDDASRLRACVALVESPIGATTTSSIEPAPLAESAANLPMSAVPPLDLRGLYLHPGAQSADFERWYGGRDVEDLVRYEFRLGRALQIVHSLPGEEAPRFLGGAEPDEMQLELAWLQARTEAPPELVDSMLSLRVGMRDTAEDYERSYARSDEEDLHLARWRLSRAADGERQRLLDERFAAGQYTSLVGESFAVG